MQSPKAHYHVGMRIIPVLDVMGGIVVRAVAGRRSEYRPLVSKLTTSVEPAEVARTLLAKSGADELYVADLDAISEGVDAGVAVQQSHHEWNKPAIG